MPHWSVKTDMGVDSHFGLPLIHSVGSSHLRARRRLVPRGGLAVSDRFVAGVAHWTDHRARAGQPTVCVRLRAQMTRGADAHFGPPAMRTRSTVGNDDCVTYKGKTLQIPPQSHRYTYVRAKAVTVHEYEDGGTDVFHGIWRLARYDANGRWLDTLGGSEVAA